MLVLVTGGTGFVGRNIVKLLTAHGHKVRCLVRHPDTASETDDSVEFVKGDVTDLQSVVSSAEGIDAAIHLVGIIQEHGQQTFQAVHVEGTRNVVLALKEKGVKRLVHMSALGTQKDAISRYYQTKWEAEEIVRSSGLDYTIFRPSIIVGEGDGFTTTLIDLVTKGPVVPVIGSGEYQMQPIPVEDVAACFVSALENNEHIRKTYELCGREALTFNQMLDEVMSALGISKSKVHMPMGVVSSGVRLLEKVTSKLPVTSDQINMLQQGNTCTDNAAVNVFGRNPIPFAEAIRQFLRRK